MKGKRKANKRRKKGEKAVEWIKMISRKNAFFVAYFEIFRFFLA